MQIFVIGRIYVPEPFFTSTSHTKPSGSGQTSAYVPFSYNWVLICDDDGIIDFYISALCAPFLLWHELRKNISVPPLPKGDDNLLTELKPMVWIFHVAKWTLRNSVGCSTKYDVVWK